MNSTRVEYKNVIYYVARITEADFLHFATYHDEIDIELLKIFFHREDGPAIIYPWEAYFWYNNGKFHRNNGPAFVEDCEIAYALNDKIYDFNDWIGELAKTDRNHALQMKLKWQGVTYEDYAKELQEQE